MLTIVLWCLAVLIVLPCLCVAATLFGTAVDMCLTPHEVDEDVIWPRAARGTHP